MLYGPRRSPLASSHGWEAHLHDPAEISVHAAELAEAVKSRDAGSQLTVVIESVADFVGGAADDALQRLIRACRSESQFVVVEGETSAFSGGWNNVVAAAKLDRWGIVLQPDQADGDVVFATDFPRVRRAEFPTGRGLYVSSGRVFRVQVFLPDVGREVGSAPHVRGG